MKSSAKKFWARVVANPLLYGGLALLAIAAAWFFFFRGSSTTEELLVVSPGDFKQEVSVSGKVIAAQEVDLGFSQGGRVTRVYVSVGSRVGAGAALAEVENGELRAAVEQRQAALQNQQARLASLKAGTRPEEIAIAESTIARDERALIDAIEDAYSESDDAVRNVIDQFITNPRTNPQLNFATTDSSLESFVEGKRLSAEKILTEWQSALSGLSATNVSSAASSAQSNLSQIVSLLSDANAALNRAITNSSVTQATMDGYITDVSAARAAVNASISGLSSAIAALDASKKNLALKRAGSTAQDIAAGEAQVRAAEADVAAARAQLQKTIIIAPFSGVVTVVDAKAGKIVSSNSPEISMISAGTFQIESFVPEINISYLQVGDKATITLDAYGEEVPFLARVVSLDPADTVRDGVSTYRALLQFEAQDDRVKPGMTANIVITTEEKVNVIAVPQGIVIERDGRKHVPVKEGDKTVEKVVTTGAVSSLGNIEILSGLREGETVVLSAD